MIETLLKDIIDDLYFYIKLYIFTYNLAYEVLKFINFYDKNDLVL